MNSIQSARVDKIVNDLPLTALEDAVAEAENLRDEQAEIDGMTEALDEAVAALQLAVDSVFKAIDAFVDAQS